MATVSREEITVGLTTLVLDDIELELIHNLLHAGPRLGRTNAYSEAASELLRDLGDVRGEISEMDELFLSPSEDYEGLPWSEAANETQYE